MKKFLTALILLASVAPRIWAAGTCTYTLSPIGTTPVFALTFKCTADASTGSYPSTLVTAIVPSAVLGSRISTAEFAPGSPAPTANWSVTLSDSLGLDLLGGNGANQSATVTGGATIGSIPVTGTLTLAITGNSVNSAQVTIVVYIAPANYAFNPKGGGGSSFTLTTTGNSGASTYGGGVLNVPIYSGGGNSLTSGPFVLTKTSATVLTFDSAAGTYPSIWPGFTTSYTFTTPTTITVSGTASTGSIHLCFSPWTGLLSVYSSLAATITLQGGGELGGPFAGSSCPYQELWTPTMTAANTWDAIAASMDHRGQGGGPVQVTGDGTSIAVSGTGVISYIGSSAPAGLTTWGSNGSYGSNDNPTANQLTCVGVVVPYPGVASTGHVAVRVNSDSGTSSFCMYNAAGTRLVTTTPGTIGSTNLAWTVAAAIPYGNNYFCYTSTNASMNVGSFQSQPTFFQQATVVATTSGVCPTTITPPSATSTYGSDVAVFLLYP